jgi:tetratricopeptide (TPR) repeat protein
LRLRARNIIADAAGRFVSEKETKEILCLLNKAQTYYDKAAQIKSDYAIVYFKRSALFIEKSLFADQNRDHIVEEALRDLKRAIHIDPDFKIRARSEGIFGHLHDDQRFKELIS